MALRLGALALALSQSVFAQYPASQDIPPTLDLDTLGNNSLYLRWRPTYHISPPNGHSNDPCGPMYDPSTDTYHIFYQSFPQHVQFGNTTWGHATSKDLVTWTDVTDWRDRSFAAIAPGPYGTYDWLGDFSGGAYPTSLDGSAPGNLTLMYTGNQAQPDFWQSPYKPYTETQNIATSSDGGVTWQKWEGNPWLVGAPEGSGWNVTGMRDPNFGPDPELSAILGRDPTDYYLNIGSGIRGVGPRAPLWAASASDLTNWTFLGALFEIPVNYTFGGDRNRTGNFGGNFEMVTFYPLIETQEFGGDGSTLHWVLTFGAEGFESFGHPLAHWSLFTLGQVQRRDNGSAEQAIQASGPTDWGNAYAINTFNDTKNNRRVAWTWSDEDLNSYGIKPQGYQGSLGLPRELYILKTDKVLAPAGGVQNGSDIWESCDDGTYTVTALAQRPLPEVVSGIDGDKSTCLGDVKVSGEQAISGFSSDHYHLQATLSQWPQDGQVGLKVRSSPDQAEFTEILYTPSNYTLTVLRDHSSLVANFSKGSYNGYYEPYTFADGNGGCTSEDITFNVFVDGSLLEVFLNDRLAMTTRIYPSKADALGAAFISTAGEATFSNVTYWDEPLNVFPDRPLNASSPLVFDPYYDTHIDFPNPFVEPGSQIYDGY